MHITVLGTNCFPMLKNCALSSNKVLLRCLCPPETLTFDGLYVNAMQCLADAIARKPSSLVGKDYNIDELFPCRSIICYGWSSVVSLSHFYSCSME